MLPQFLLPETTVREAGASPDLNIADQAGGTLILTLGITRIIEQESGTYSGRVHPHNGYYAGDFSGLRHGTRNSDTRIPTRSTRVLDSRAV